MTAHTDPVLECPNDRTDMIVAEVNQGRAQVNAGSRNRHALAAALARFGCCKSSEAPSLVQALLQHGRAQGESHHIVRMVLFASSGERADGIGFISITCFVSSMTICVKSKVPWDTWICTIRHSLGSRSCGNATSR